MSFFISIYDNRVQLKKVLIARKNKFLINKYEVIKISDIYDNLTSKSKRDSIAFENEQIGICSFYWGKGKFITLTY